MLFCKTNNSNTHKPTETESKYRPHDAASAMSAYLVLLDLHWKGWLERQV